MATGNPADAPTFESLDDRAARHSRTPSEPSLLVRVLEPLASLKLTVTLFALAIFIVLAGTLAQRYEGIWQVINTYFRQTDNLGFVWVDLAIFFPASWDVPGGFPFPGGWLIGAALFVNLLAAHILRFKVQTTGARLWGGLAVIALGIAATAGVIASGMNKQPETQLSDDFAALVWHGVRAAMVILTIACGYMLYIVERDRRGTAYWILFALVNLLAIFNLLLFVMPDLRLDKPGLRIMWQLIKGGGAGLLLLAGCALVFRRRAGIVLLHAGVGLMMIGELWTGISAEEAQMPVFEGYPGYYIEDVRVPELVVVDHSDAESDREVVISRSMLVEFAKDEAEVIKHEELPFDIRIIEYFDNVDFSSLATSMTPDDPRAPEGLNEFTGLGRTHWVKGRPTVSGAEASERSDIPSANIELLDRDSGERLGKYLVSILFTLNPMENRQYVELDDKFYEIALRFKRTYTPAQLAYKEFRFDKYVGTEQAKNYSARLQLRDSAKGINSEVHLWMNNPLRYDGRTYYQSGYRPDPRWPSGEKQATVLQVVENESWMIPYVGCSLVATGMLAHFGLALTNFLQRRKQGQMSFRSDQGMWSYLVPAAVVLLCSVYVAGKARPADTSPGELAIQKFGELPVAYQGRVKPIDTVARNALRAVSNRDYLEVEVAQRGSSEPKTTRRPATQWLLDLISRSPRGEQHRVVRIENLEVLNMLGLERRKGYRYSLDEIRGGGEEMSEDYLAFVKQFEAAQEKRRADAPLSYLERKILETAERLSVVRNLEEAFNYPPLRMEFIREDAPLYLQYIDQRRPALVHVIPPASSDDDWKVLSESVADVVLGRSKQEMTLSWFAMLEAYAKGDASGFNRHLRELTSSAAELQENFQEVSSQNTAQQSDGPASIGVAHAERLDLERVQFESWFNRFDPFAVARVFYVAAFVLSVGAWLVWGTTLNRAALWLLMLTFAVHTFGLAARIYISGRPPVTNLYSSAVFIGWGCVLLGMVFEGIYRIGFGNIMASVAGFTTLLISHYLAADGDTMKVLEAVLDTNFWLATHVLCITLGYSTTFVAGLFGIFYVLGDSFVPRFDDTKRKVLSRMTYGTLCFAILFSFVGTVLGGLWADDSWGRFWGWDPKENGALMIVIWNALVLHARWGGLVGQRGMATLAIFGNVITAWSWFGVNQLGVGLHSYGFTSGTTLWLTAFALSQLALVTLGAIPRRVWRGA